MKRPEWEELEDDEKPQGCEFPDDYDDDDDDEPERVPRSGRRQLMPIERLR